MIKINLLPYKKKKKKPKPVPTFLITSALLLTASVIISFYALYFLKLKISSFEKQKAENNKKIAELKDRIKEVEDFERLNQAFTDRKNIIEQLRKNQTVPVKILDEISRRLTDGVWFTSMSIDNVNINIDGMGFSNPEIVTLVQSLKGSPVFKEVYLHGTQQSSSEGVEVFTFKITMQANI